MTDWYMLEIDAMALSTRQAASGQGVRAYLHVSPEDATTAILKLLREGLDPDPIMDYIQREEW